MPQKANMPLHSRRRSPDGRFQLDYRLPGKNLRLQSRQTLFLPAIKPFPWAMRRLIEENLYWAIVYCRWFDDSNWPTIRKTFFGELPPIIRQVIPILARRNIQANLQGHGMGRHTPEEIYDIGLKDLTAIADFLADKPYLMGEEATTVDASAYGFAG